MSKPEQVLQLEPPIELSFRGPFTDVVTSELKLTNPSERRVCFKVKTTAPKRYCVRPNSGIIEPGTTVAVAVMLQPFEYDPKEKNKHKFMVQTMFAPEGPIESQENLWKDVPPENLMDSKLRCVFELPLDTTTQNNLDSKLSNEENIKPNIAKVSPASPDRSSPKASNLEVELRKAMEESKRLNTEVQKLKAENTNLKDEGVRLRRMAVSDTVSSTPSSRSQAATSQVQDSPAVPPIVYVIAAILLGIILGKFIL